MSIWILRDKSTGRSQTITWDELPAAAWKLVPPPRAKGEDRDNVIGLHAQLTAPRTAGGHDIDADIDALGLLVRSPGVEDVHITYTGLVHVGIGGRRGARTVSVSSGDNRPVVYLRVLDSAYRPWFALVTPDVESYGHDEDQFSHSILRAKTVKELREQIAEKLTTDEFGLLDDPVLDAVADEQNAAVAEWQSRQTADV